MSQETPSNIKPTSFLSMDPSPSLIIDTLSPVVGVVVPPPQRQPTMSINLGSSASSSSSSTGASSNNHGQNNRHDASANPWEKSLLRYFPRVPKFSEIPIGLQGIEGYPESLYQTIFNSEVNRVVQSAPFVLDVLNLIFKYLPLESLGRLARVSHGYLVLSESDTLWKELVQRDFPKFKFNTEEHYEFPRFSTEEQHIVPYGNYKRIYKNLRSRQCLMEEFSLTEERVDTLPFITESEDYSMILAEARNPVSPVDQFGITNRISCLSECSYPESDKEIEELRKEIKITFAGLHRYITENSIRFIHALAGLSQGQASLCQYQHAIIAFRRITPHNLELFGKMLEKISAKRNVLSSQIATLNGDELAQEVCSYAASGLERFDFKNIVGEVKFANQLAADLVDILYDLVAQVVAIFLDGSLYGREIELSELIDMIQYEEVFNFFALLTKSVYTDALRSWLLCERRFDFMDLSRKIGLTQALTQIQDCSNVEFHGLVEYKVRSSCDWRNFFESTRWARPVKPNEDELLRRIFRDLFSDSQYQVQRDIFTYRKLWETPQNDQEFSYPEILKSLLASGVLITDELLQQVVSIQTSSSSSSTTSSPNMVFNFTCQSSVNGDGKASRKLKMKVYRHELEKGFAANEYRLNSVYRLEATCPELEKFEQAIAAIFVDKYRSFWEQRLNASNMRQQMRLFKVAMGNMKNPYFDVKNLLDFFGLLNGWLPSASDCKIVDEIGVVKQACFFARIFDHSMLSRLQRCVGELAVVKNRLEVFFNVQQTIQKLVASRLLNCYIHTDAIKGMKKLGDALTVTVAKKFANNALRQEQLSFFRNRQAGPVREFYKIIREIDIKGYATIDRAVKELAAFIARNFSDTARNSSAPPVKYSW